MINTSEMVQYVTQSQRTYFP